MRGRGKDTTRRHAHYGLMASISFLFPMSLFCSEVETDKERERNGGNRGESMNAPYGLRGLAQLLILYVLFKFEAVREKEKWREGGKRGESIDAPFGI